MEFGVLFIAGLFVLLLIMLLSSALRVVQQYEAGVVFRLGRLVHGRGPGLTVIYPVIDRLVKVDMRVRTLDVPSQEMITADTVTVKVNAVVYFRVVDAEASVVRVENYAFASLQIAQTTLRSVIGSTDLATLLSRREEVNDRLQRIIDEQTEPWGVKVTVVEVKDVELPGDMQRAMARQAEAERERRAKVIHAEGEYEAATRLAEAAKIINSEPAALQLRYLQTLAGMGGDRATTVVFPLPINILRGFFGGDEDQGKGGPGA